MFGLEVLGGIANVPFKFEMTFAYPSFRAETDKSIRSRVFFRDLFGLYIGQGDGAGVSNCVLPHMQYRDGRKGSKDDGKFYGFEHGEGWPRVATFVNTPSPGIVAV